MQPVHTHCTATGQLVYLTDLDHLSAAGPLLARIGQDPAGLLVGEVHAALTAQDEGAALLHLEVLEPPQQRIQQGQGEPGGFLLSLPLEAKLYDSAGGRWVLDVNLVLTVSDHAGGDDFALQTDFMVNSAVQLED